MDASSIAKHAESPLSKEARHWRGTDRYAQLPCLLGYSKANGSGVKPRHKGGKMMSGSCAQSSQAGVPKGAISMLQEYVQCSHTFHVPPNYSVLQWSFHSKMADAATLEFRAIVAFLLEGVPHHVAGTWQPKKKDAQRDAAERALDFFATRWDNDIKKMIENASYVENQAYEEELLKEYCQQLDCCGGQAPSMTVQWEGDACHAVVEITLLGAPHNFAGAVHKSEAAARTDAARRVLWYLHHPSYLDAFELDPSAVAIVTRKIPSPPATWARDAEVEGALEAAERKTAIMKVQNRLQQTFSRDLRPGCSVWTWDYEMDTNDEEWPNFCRARVYIPVIGKTFAGDWVRGQRDAQINAMQQVSSFLDKLEFEAST